MITFNPCPKQKPIRLKGKAYTEFRRQVYLRASGCCEICGSPAPLLNQYGYWDAFNCGHVSHIKGHGAGGGDTLDNVKWKCRSCHLDKEHGPKWSKKYQKG